MDKALELDFEFSNQPYEFVDLENGESIRLQPGEIKSIYKERMQHYIETLKLRCSQYKIDFVPVDIHDGFKLVLQSYLLKRTKMMI